MATKFFRTGFLFAALTLLGGTSGCGQLSFMEVNVRVGLTTAVDASCLFTIDRCEVRVSGAESDFFTLASSSCSQQTNFKPDFQYGTDEDSGMIAFHVEIFDPNGKKLGQGDGSGAIKAGGRQNVMVPVVADAAAFAATGACTPP